MPRDNIQTLTEPSLGDHFGGQVWKKSIGPVNGGRQEVGPDIVDRFDQS